MLQIPYRNKSKWGFCNPEKQIVIPLKFQFARPFSDGLAAVKLNDKYGYINNKGFTIIPFLYDLALDFEDGIAFVVPELKVKDGWEYVHINKKNETVGKGFKPLPPDSTQPLALEEWKSYTRSDGYSTKYYYKNKNGHSVLGPFNYARRFKEGIGIASGPLGKYLFFNEEGKELFAKKVISVEDYSEGFAAAQFDWRVGFIDQKGNEIKLENYTNVRSFRNGFAAIERDGINWGVFDFKNYTKEKKGKWGFIDKSFNEVVKTIYDSVSDFENGLALTNCNNKIGYIDVHGNQYWDD